MMLRKIVGKIVSMVAIVGVVGAMGLGVKAHSVDATIAAVDVLERGNDAVLENICSVAFPCGSNGGSGSVISVVNVIENVFATTDVNIRTGPGVDYESVAVLKRGTSIVRIGIANNGWSSVNYNGQIAYIHSDYLCEFRFCETFYVSAQIDVRSGPGNNYRKIGMLSAGDAVRVVMKLDNGWSKILYNDGAEAYVLSGYLGTDELEHDEEGAGKVFLGRLSVPSVGVDVALYTCSMNSNYLGIQQGIVDADDSAAYLFSNTINGNIIVDHAFQGFHKMKASIPYETYAYIDCGYEVREYVCVGIGEGHNYCSDLVDWNGDSLHRGDITGGLAMYTCNDETGLSVTISYWEPV